MTIEIHVQVDGDDKGGDGSQRRPLRTLAAAQYAARQARGAPASEGVDVVVGDGVHHLDRALVLVARDSGNPGAPVVYRSAPNARPVLSGGVPVVDWTQVGPTVWTAPLPLPTRQVFLNGHRLARTSGRLPDGTVRTDSGYELPDDSAAAWSRPDHAEFVYNVNWTQMRGCVAAVRGRSITMDQPWFANARWHPMAMVDLPSRVENVFEWLPDQPGRFFADAEAQRLYVNPPTGVVLDEAFVVAAVLESAVEVRGTADAPVRHVSLEGLTFAHTTWSLCLDGERGLAALQANLALTGDLGGWDAEDSPRWHGSMMPAAVTTTWTHDVSVVGCRFTHLGAAGLDVGRGCRGVTVTGNRFDGISGTAVQIGNGDDAHPADEDAVVGVTVSNNVVREAAMEFEGGVGIWAGYVAGLTVAHNDLADLPYSGISVGWGWGAMDPTVMRDNEILCNRIHRPVRTLLDGGGIYVLSAQPGMRIAGNVVTDQPTISGALYLDDGARYVVVENNVVIGCGPTEPPVVWLHDEEVVLDEEWGSFLFKGCDHVVQQNWWDRETDYCWSLASYTAVGDNHRVQGLDGVPADLVAAAGLEPSHRHLLISPPTL